MTDSSKRYGLGHIVGVREGDIGEIIGMTLETVTVRYKDQEDITVSWNSIYPVPVSVEMMQKIGFSIIKKQDLLHHTEYLMDIKINGRFYSSKGILLKDRSIWSFNNVSARFIHQIQSLIWIIEPKIDFSLD
jgi:hypothetical protein